MVDVDKMLEDWVEEEGLESILEEADLTDVEVVFLLWNGGHLKLPDWLTRCYEDELRPGEEED